MIVKDANVLLKSAQTTSAQLARWQQLIMTSILYLLRNMSAMLAQKVMQDHIVKGKLN